MVYLSSVVAFATLALFAPTAVYGRAIVDKRQDDYHWINTWTSMPQLVEQNNMPPSPFTSGNTVLKDATLRQTLHLSVATSKLKITFSNTFGTSDLPITAATLGLPTNNATGSSSIQPSPILPITVGGKTTFTIPKGQTLTSDELPLSLHPQSTISISTFSSAGQPGGITGHPGSRTTSFFTPGNTISSQTLSSPTKSVHWYFISAVQAYVPRATSSLVILGDSITDGRGSTDDANNRWPDLLLTRLIKNNKSTLAINNQAAGGNTVLSGGLGPPLLSRYTRDAITQPGVKYVMIFEGVNDIGSAANSASSQSGIGDQLIKAYTQIVKDAKKAGYVTVGGTIMPFGGSQYAGAEREKTRKRVNKWIMEGGVFDHSVDLAKMVASKSDESVLDAKYNGGDSLHPNVVGYQAVADGFPVEIFKE